MIELQRDDTCEKRRECDRQARDAIEIQQRLDDEERKATLPLHGRGRIRRFSCSSFEARSGAENISTTRAREPHASRLIKRELLFSLTYSTAHYHFCHS